MKDVLIDVVFVLAAVFVTSTGDGKATIENMIEVHPTRDACRTSLNASREASKILQSLGKTTVYLSECEAIKVTPVQ